MNPADIRADTRLDGMFRRSLAGRCFGERAVASRRKRRFLDIRQAEARQPLRKPAAEGRSIWFFVETKAMKTQSLAATTGSWTVPGSARQ